MAVFGIAATILSAIAVYLLKSTLVATRGAVREAGNANDLARESMVMSNRAWVALEKVSLLHPTAISEDGTCWQVQATGQNFGRTPAINTTVHFGYYFLESTEDPFALAQSRFVEQLRRESLREHQIGPGLFPGEPFVVRELSWVKRDAVHAAIGTNPSTGKRTVSAILFVGVSYRVIGDDAPHVTYRPYSLFNCPVGTAIPEGQEIEVSPMPFNAGITD
jgi:hypothetical protein